MRGSERQRDEHGLYIDHFHHPVESDPACMLVKLKHRRAQRCCLEAGRLHGVPLHSIMVRVDLLHCRGKCREAGLSAIGLAF